MNSSDFRAEARKKLDGKWGKAAILTLVYAVIIGVINFIESKFPKSMEGLASLAVTIIGVPLTYGCTLSLFRLYKGDEVGNLDFWSTGFQNFKRSWGLALNIAVKMIIPIIMIIAGFIITAIGGSMIFYRSLSVHSTASSGSGLAIIGIIILFVGYVWTFVKSYYYQLAMLIAFDNPEMDTKDTVLQSEKMMTGNRAKLFVLQLSFIGWVILAGFTFGIGFLWLIPYIQFAIIAFYDYLNGQNDKEKEVDNIEVNIKEPEENSIEYQNDPISEE